MNQDNSTHVMCLQKGIRHPQVLSMEPTRNNIKHAASLHSTAFFALKSGNCIECDFLPRSRVAENNADSKGVTGLCEGCKTLKAVDITAETRSRHELTLMSAPRPSAEIA